MEKIASADFEYTQVVHQLVTLVRRQRPLRTVGLVIACIFLCLLIIETIGFSNGLGVNILTALLFIVLVAGSIFGVWLGFTGAGKRAGASEKALEAFYRGHGITEKHHGKWTMRERVDVEPGGIAVSWGPIGCKNKDLVRVFTPWADWKYLVDAQDYIVLICKTPEDGIMQSAIGENPTNDGKRSDAAIPKKRLQGLKSEALVDLLRDEIGR